MPFKIIKNSVKPIIGNVSPHARERVDLARQVTRTSWQDMQKMMVELDMPIKLEQLNASQCKRLQDRMYKGMYGQR